MFDLPFDSINDLFKQAFLFRKHKRMPVALMVLLIIAGAPFIGVSALLYGVYQVLIFIFNLLKSPADYLLKFIKNVGDDVKHATQAIVYLIGFPLVFILNALMVLIVPVLFVLYFLVNVFTYLWTLGDTKINVYICKEVKREFDVVKEPKYQVNLLVLQTVLIYVCIAVFVTFVVLANVLTNVNAINISRIVTYLSTIPFVTLFAMSKLFQKEELASGEGDKAPVNENAPIVKEKAVVVGKNNATGVFDWILPIAMVVFSAAALVLSFFKGFAVSGTWYSIYFTQNLQVLGIVLVAVAFVECLFALLFKFRCRVLKYSLEMVLSVATIALGSVLVGVVLAKVLEVVRTAPTWNLDIMLFIALGMIAGTIAVSVWYFIRLLVKAIKNK